MGWAARLPREAADQVEVIAPRPFDPDAEWRVLATEEPVTWSQEGLDDCCWYCAVSAEWDKSGVYATHEADCAWVRARLHYGIDLGRHKVKVTSADVGGFDFDPRQHRRARVERDRQTPVD